MKVPFNQLRRLYLEQKAEIDSALGDCCEAGDYILGKAVLSFERGFKESLVGKGEGQVVACNSGTDALVLSLLTIGVGRGDRVLTVSHTALPTLVAIRMTGAEITYVDVDDNTWLMATERLADSITPEVKAIIPVHLYGGMVSIEAIRLVLNACGREDISIVEDTAQAQGASCIAGAAGTLGRFGAFSFYPTKNLGALGDGGGIFCRSPEDASTLRKLRNYGREDRAGEVLPRGMNSRLDEIQAAILELRLQRVAEWNQRKAAVMKRYREEFRGLPIRFQTLSEGVCPAWHLCVIRLESNSVRDSLQRYLLEKGVEVLIHYERPGHSQSVFRPRAAVSLEVTERLCGEILSLPMSAGMLPEEQSYVIEMVRAYFQ